MQPIYKDGDKSRVDTASYRGIYLSSALAKLFEGMLISRLTKFTEIHNTLTENQLGTRPGRQSHDVIYCLTSLIQYNISQQGTSNQLAYMQACMVCMYACVHIGVHCWQDGVSLRGSNTDGNPSYGSVGWKPLVWVCHVLYYFPIETRETSRTGLPFVGVYTCMYLRIHIHG